jgi:peptide/nickel transport system substrate-binding protein
MKNVKILVCILTAILLVMTIYAILPALSSPPDIDTTTMNVGTIGEPKNVDPSQAYDTASGELIMNVYDSIFEFGSESSNLATKNATFPTGIPTIPGNDSVNVGSDVATLGATTDVSGICYYPPSVTVTNVTTGASTWILQVNTNLVFQPWQEPNGNYVVDENVTWQDVVYYFQRFFVQDSHNSPEWMLMGPFFGVSNWDAYEVGTGPSLGANEPLIASLIENAITGWTNATGQYVEFNFAYAATGMYDILCQTWSSIPPMQWSIDHGCWNDTFNVPATVMTNVPYNYTEGGFETGWSAAYRRWPSDLFTPLDEHTTTNGLLVSGGSQYGASAEPAMCGTGPYSFTTWDQATDYWRIDAFQIGDHGSLYGCVSHPWPGPYGPSDPAPTTVTDTGINTWATREMLFLGGALDICYVPEANMYSMLQSPSPGNDYTPIPGITLYYNIPTLETDAIFFTLNVTAGSPYTPIVNGNPDPTFFSSLLVREAFCQALNSSEYISGAFYGEAVQPATWWCIGLTPPQGLANATQAPPWEVNETAVYDDLQAAGVSSFTMTILYNTGNTEREIACEEMAQTFADINTIYSTKYDLIVGSENWPTYLDQAATSGLPIFMIGWLADFSDADDFAVPFMATTGAFTEWQVFSNSTIDALLSAEEALSPSPVNLTAGSPYLQRCADFIQLQEDYIQNAISLPTDQPLARHWSRSYVYGYYVNQLYPGLYYQDLYKATPVTVENVELDITNTLNPIVSYSQIYVWYGEPGAIGGAMLVGGGISNALITPMEFYIQVTDRATSGTNAAELYATIGLFREPGEAGLAKAYGNGTEILIAEGQTLNTTFTWVEDGVNEGITATPAGIVYTVGADSYPVYVAGASANDTNPSLEQVTNGTFVAKTLVGDLTGTGIVDIYSAIALAEAYGSTPGMTNWNPLADIKNDGIVDIFDAVALAENFGMSVGSIQNP